MHLQLYRVYKALLINNYSYLQFLHIIIYFNHRRALKELALIATIKMHENRKNSECQMPNSKCEMQNAKCET